MKDLTKYYIDLSKCTEEQRKHIFSLLPEGLSSYQYNIDEYHFILHYGHYEWWVSGTKPPYGKTEITYPEFIKLFEPKTLTESLEEYFKNTSLEQVQKDWESASEFDGVNSPKVVELFEGGEGENEVSFGWIEVEAEKPNFDDYCYCWLLTKDGEVLLREWNPHSKRFYGWREVYFTHYQPIIKPLQPKF